jgi:hypothetical protein
MYLTPREYRWLWLRHLPVLRLSRDGHLHPAAASLGSSAPWFKRRLCVLKTLAPQASSNFGKSAKTGAFDSKNLAMSPEILR